MRKVILEDNISHHKFFFFFPYFINLVKWCFFGHSSFYFIKYGKTWKANKFLVESILLEFYLQKLTINTEESCRLEIICAFNTLFWYMQVVRFRILEKPKEDVFSLELLVYSLSNVILSEVYLVV